MLQNIIYFVNYKNLQLFLNKINISNSIFQIVSVFNDITEWPLVFEKFLQGFLNFFQVFKITRI